MKVKITSWYPAFGQISILDIKTGKKYDDLEYEFVAAKPSTYDYIKEIISKKDIPLSENGWIVEIEGKTITKIKWIKLKSVHELREAKLKRILGSPLKRFFRKLLG